MHTAIHVAFQVINRHDWKSCETSLLLSCCGSTTESSAFDTGTEQKQVGDYYCFHDVFVGWFQFVSYQFQIQKRYWLFASGSKGATLSLGDVISLGTTRMIVQGDLFFYHARVNKNLRPSLSDKER